MKTQNFPHHSRERDEPEKVGKRFRESQTILKKRTRTQLSISYNLTRTIINRQLQNVRIPTIHTRNITRESAADSEHESQRV